MKLAIRIVALTFVLAAAVTGATPAKAPLLDASLLGFTPPGPIPACNPFIQQCPPIR
jgi:hypothetical protein